MKIMFDKKIAVKIATGLISITLLYISCYFMLKGAGSRVTERNVIIFVFAIILLSASKKVFKYLVFPVVILYSIYSPIGLVFGLPTFKHIISFISTDLLEAKEFLSQIPIIYFFTPILIIGPFILYSLINKKYNIKLYNNKTFLSLSVIFIILQQQPLELINNSISSIKKVNHEYNELEKLSSMNEWGASKLKNNNYINYVLIIGESARKDYHHAYGYPINNTPFMSSSNGIIIDGMTSGGIYTVQSLRLMLTEPNRKNWEPSYNRNLIDLINSAGIKTYWLSNQGYLGAYDTPISAIAKKSNYKYFIKSGEYSSKNTSDFMLLDELKKIVLSNNKKFIVLHLYGSHPNACDRVSDYRLITHVNDDKYSYINCYISSINKTDDFLKEVYQILNKQHKEKNDSFSMVYFSDHGMATDLTNKVIQLNNKNESKLHFNIPLFSISSDSIDRKVCHSFKSGLNFTTGIANWVGISNDYINPEYSLFDCIDDPNDFGLKNRINDNPVEIDKAIDIRGK
ncbi:phosphoethanolamine transferase [Providencia rettgeri]